jgi:hypothetical protein
VESGQITTDPLGPLMIQPSIQAVLANLFMAVVLPTRN